MRRRADAEVTAAARRLLLVAAGLVFLAGLVLFVLPRRTAEWFAWTVEPPMTAVFLGAAYWSSAVLEVAGARSSTWRRASLSVWAVLAFTTLTLVVTVVHLDKFHLGGQHPASAQGVAWAWLAIYAVVPVLLLAVARLQGRRGSTRATSSTRPLPTGLRALLVLLAAALGLSGLMLLVVPADAAQWWPWTLTPLTGRAIGAWLVGLGWAAGHAALADDVGSVRPVGLTGVTFVALQALALAREGQALTWSEPSAASYVVALVAIGVASGWILVLRTPVTQRGRVAA